MSPSFYLIYFLLVYWQSIALPRNLLPLRFRCVKETSGEKTSGAIQDNSFWDKSNILSDVNPLNMFTSALNMDSLFPLKSRVSKEIKPENVLEDSMVLIMLSCKLKS